MEEEVKNKNFFKKLWYSITKFEQYPIMAMEGLKSAIRYLIILSAIISVFMMACSLHEMKTMISNAANYIKDNIPEFTYLNGNISMESEEPIIIEDVEKTGIDRIVINTLSENDEEKEKIQAENSKQGLTAILFKDEVILKLEMEEYTSVEQKYTYVDIISNFVGRNVEQFSKTEFVQYLTSKEMRTFDITYAISTFAYYFIENLIVILVYSLEIALLGWITTVILRIKMRFKALYNMAAYAITLPTILMTVYVIVNYITGFTIKEFQIAYIAIAYIYLAAAIFILKDDFIRKMQEVGKIQQEQLKVREEIKKQEEQDERKEDKKENKKEDDKTDDEPQGSEA